MAASSCGRTNQGEVKMSHNLKTRIGEGIIVCMVLALGWGVATVSAASLNNTIQNPGGAKQEESSNARGGISPEGHQLIKASVINDDPKAYKINVRKMANLNADENAETFAVYITSSAPDTCADFRKLKLPYKKPSKYEREFNLRKHPQVLKALDEYGCVVMRNIPPAKG